jgi:hypothetical protein
MRCDRFLRLPATLGATLLVGGVSGLAAPASAFIRIDDFRDPQVVVLPDGQDYGYDSAISPKVLGGERDITLVRLSPSSGELAVTVAPDDSEQLFLDNGAGAYVELTLVYDGVDGDPGGIDLSGLGDVDLTELGTENRFALRLRADEPATAFVQIFDTNDPSGNTWSAGSLEIAPTDALAWHELPFTALNEVGAAGPADVRNVGAILLRLSGSAGADFEIDDFRVPEPGAGVAGLAALLALAVVRRTGL